MTDGPTRIVVKIGGSLYDHPKLGPALRQFIDGLNDAAILLVPGGGVAANVIRDYCSTHGLPTERAHWMAIQMMRVNAGLLSHFFPSAGMVSHPREARSANISILNAESFCRVIERGPGALPPDWEVTSDAIAARAAEAWGAKLIMLKSTSKDESQSWDEAADQQLVDGAFPGIVQRAGLKVEWIDFRSWIEERFRISQRIP